MLDSVEGFEFEPRGASFLPENWTNMVEDTSASSSSSVGDISWFLNGYKHKALVNIDGGEQPVLKHVQLALKDVERLETN